MHPASLFMLIFSAALLLYGLALVGTKDSKLVPYSYSSKMDPKEVIRIGKIVMALAVVIALASVTASADLFDALLVFAGGMFLVVHIGKG